jgi:hypothetical protein
VLLLLLLRRRVGLLGLQWIHIVCLKSQQPALLMLLLYLSVALLDVADGCSCSGAAAGVGLCAYETVSHIGAASCYYNVSRLFWLSWSRLESLQAIE